MQISILFMCIWLVTWSHVVKEQNVTLGQG